MPKKKNIEEKNLIPAVEVGKHFGYTKDYILLLIKQGKISGKKIGHKWFADLASAKNFFETASREREERRKKISIERKAEFQSSQSKVIFTKPQFSASPKVVSGKRSALVETCAVMLIGLTVGLLGYVASNASVYQVATTYQAVAEEGFFKKIALSLYDLLTPHTFDMETIQVSTSTSEVFIAGDTESVSGVTRSDSPIDTTVRGGSVVVTPSGQTSTSTLREIANSFSDEVVVTHDPESPDTGVIIPKFKKHEGEAYRFLMVPIQEHDQVKTDNPTS